MTAHRVADDDAGARAAVWIALGELYLDTRMTPYTQQRIAHLLAASPYSIEALHRILVDEVHPALHANLMQVAGEWAGFDDDWLVARVREVRARPLWRRRLSRLTLDLVRDDWRVVREHVIEKRAVEQPALESCAAESRAAEKRALEMRADEARKDTPRQA